MDNSPISSKYSKMKNLLQHTVPSWKNSVHNLRILQKILLLLKRSYSDKNEKQIRVTSNFKKRPRVNFVATFAEPLRSHSY